ncbi:PKD domain-containing protein [uncultured Paraglaciecola sp.]|uniref:PKD domain-containing protein n=1 Tax=uncultured Paraglaciecola sp. TaxID=1765024 RepID=UPI0030DA1442|tara:strand:- start:443 stop:3604 length:3162 start_codon:yes stop_codon:yes gene_type:complete
MKVNNFTLPTLLYLLCILILSACGGSDNTESSPTPSTNNAPSANAGSDQNIQENQLVTLDASASSDTDGSISTFQWSQTAGTAVALSASDVAMPTFTTPLLNASETLTFQVTVTDNDGATATATVNIMIEHLNLLPTADAGDDQYVDENTEVNLSAAQSSDLDGTISQYSWTQTAGVSVTLSDAAGVNPSFTAPDVDTVTTLTFELMVTDDMGTSASASINVIINPIADNEAPSALFEDSILINELYYEYTERIGDKVWVMGYFGNTTINEDGAAFLVDNMLRLEVDEAFPHHTFIRLDGQLPPDSWHGDMLLVYGEIKDYATESGEMAIQPTPLLTVEKFELLKAFEQNNSWDNIFLKSDITAENTVEKSALSHSDAVDDFILPIAKSLFTAQLAGTQAQECDRSVIISGGVDLSNNHKRYEDNVMAKFNKMKELGFTDDQIEIFYNDGGEIDVNGTNIVDEKTTNAKLKAHFEKLAEDMPGSCTLTIFVTDHGIGNNLQQGYVGARPAFTGEEATNGKLHDENTFKFDARAKTRVISDSFVFQEQNWLIKKDETGNVFVFKWDGEQWVYRGENTNGDNIVSETELGGEDINGDGDTTDSDFGISVAWLTNRALGNRVYYGNNWDTDGDGKNDVRLRWDGTRYVVERLVGTQWQEMGRDTNGDYVIDIIDGGVDWNLDGDKADQVAFHEGINLWGNEVLWDDAFAELIKPLSDKGVHIMMEMVSCFSGGFVPNIKDMVENIYTGSSEDTKHWNRVGDDGKIVATDEMVFLEKLVGIDTDSWNAAADAATAADDALATAQKATKNIHVHEQTTRFATDTLFELKAEGEYNILLDLPDDLVGQIYDFEFILGLQKPRWTNVTFPDGLPDGLQIEDAPGGIRVFSDNPIDDELIFAIAIEEGTPEEQIRIEFTDVNHKRLGYTMAQMGSFETPSEQISFAENYHNCVNHTDHGQSSPSILEWVLFAELLETSPFSDIAITVEVTTPSGEKSTHEIVLNAEGKAFLLYQIFVYGDYGLEVISAENVPTQEALVLAGTLLFPFLVTAEETNKGQCGE